MWVKLKEEENKNEIQLIKTDKIQRIFKGKYEGECDGGEYELCIDFGNDGLNIYRKSEAEIDKIIQALIGDETIKEVE